MEAWDRRLTSELVNETRVGSSYKYELIESSFSPKFKARILLWPLSVAAT